MITNDIHLAPFLSAHRTPTPHSRRFEKGRRWLSTRAPLASRHVFITQQWVIPCSPVSSLVVGGSQSPWALFPSRPTVHTRLSPCHELMCGTSTLLRIDQTRCQDMACGPPKGGLHSGSSTFCADPDMAPSTRSRPLWKVIDNCCWSRTGRSAPRRRQRRQSLFFNSRAQRNFVPNLEY